MRFISHIADLIMSMTFVFSLSQMPVIACTSFHFGLGGSNFV